MTSASPLRSPTPDLYDDEFDSPTPSEKGDIVRPPSLAPTPPDSPHDSIHKNDFSDELNISSRQSFTRQQDTPNGHASRQDTRNTFHQSFSRGETFISRNGSRISQHTYTAEEVHYDEDFDNDDDFHSERSYTPERELSNLSNRSNEAGADSPTDENPYYEDESKKLADLTNLHSHNSLASVKIIPDEAKQTENQFRRPAMGSRNLTILSVTKSVKKLPYSNRKSVRSNRNGLSRMSTASRQLDVTDLRREMLVIGDEIETLKIENKVLKRNNILVTHQLDKREKEEEEIPNLYDRQVKEHRVLKDQLGRQQERYDKVHYRLRRTEKNLAESQREENSLEKRAEECDLKERSRLRKQVEKVEQENQICDEKIRQLEKYVDNLEKCHEAEITAEVEKQMATQADIDLLNEQTQATKQSVQAKEAELEKFKIQRPSRMAMSRALTNTAMSGHMSMIAESPKPPANHRSDAHTSQLKALPAPPVKLAEVTPAKVQAKLTQAKVSAKANAGMTPAKELELTHGTSNNKQETVKITPSPPATSRPNHKNSRSTRAKVSIDKPIHKPADQRAPPKPVVQSKQGPRATVRSTNHSTDKNNKVVDDEKKAELIRTNMALSQTMKVQKQPTNTQPTVPSEAPPMNREDSWAAVKAVQAGISPTAVKGNESQQSRGVVSLSKSLRQQTFYIAKSPSNDAVGSEEETSASILEAARRKEEAESLEKKEALLKDIRDTSEGHKSLFSNSINNSMEPNPREEFSFNHTYSSDSRSVAKAPLRINDDDISLNTNNTVGSFDFGGYQPSGFSQPSPKVNHEHSFNGLSESSFNVRKEPIRAPDKTNFWEMDNGRSDNSSGQRKRETTIMNKRRLPSDIFGDPLDELQL